MTSKTDKKPIKLNQGWVIIQKYDAVIVYNEELQSQIATLEAENAKLKADYIDECHRHTENVSKLEAENSNLKKQIEGMCRVQADEIAERVSFHIANYIAAIRRQVFEIFMCKSKPMLNQPRTNREKAIHQEMFKEYCNKADDVLKIIDEPEKASTDARPKTETLATKIRPEILRFADIMEVVMSKYDSEKGDSWKRMPHDELQAMLLKEVEESNVDNAKIKEWIDIANFCMMIYNNTIDGGSEKHILESHKSDKVSGLLVTPKPTKDKTVCKKCGTYIGECGGWACKCDLPRQKPSKKKEGGKG